MTRVKITEGSFKGRTGVVIGEGRGWLVNINDGEIVAEFPTDWLELQD